MTQENLQEIDEELIENPEMDTEESGTSEDAETETVTDESNQNKDPAGFTKRMNQKHFELMEEKRLREAAEAEVINLKSKLPNVQKPVIPDLPDPYDEDYDIRIKQRDEAIRNAAIYEANEEIRNNQIQSQNKAEQERKNNDLVKSVETYSGRAKELGISENELAVAGKAIAAYGMHDDVAHFILSDDKGPAITTFLARNPAELEAISKLSPMQAAVHISNVIKPKLQLKNKISAIPEPADTLSGGGVKKSERGPKGAKYE